jgi:type III restriction enzyme
MILKNYQQKVVDTLQQFLITAHQHRQSARQTRQEAEQARAILPENLRHLVPMNATANWVRQTFTELRLPYNDQSINGLQEPYPRLCVKVPTGGGKTLLAVETIREYQNEFARRRTGLVVWVVPSETIYTQTVARLRDKSQYLRQLLDQCSGGHTLILEKGQRLTEQDLAENLVVLFVMIQSISRTNGKDALKVFQDSGGYDSFFPPDNRYDLHGALLERIPNLDVISDVTRADFPLVRTSLGNAIRLTNPLIIIDEIHKVYSDAARATIDGLNPSLVVGFSATPKAGMNIVIAITGLELKAEDMVKLDMHIVPPTNTDEGDMWQDMLRQIRHKRDELEAQAQQVQEQQGLYVRPTALIQVESTGQNQRGKAGVHSLDVKDYLLEIGIPADQIAIKTSAQNDIEDVDLFARNCPVRYIITKEALKEGWDFSFTYILGIIPNVSSTSSLTQLVGRILRQPYARKFGVPALDESYVYFSKGRTSELLDKIRNSFRDEGLEDLLQQNVKVQDTASDVPLKTVQIRKQFNQHGNAFYLPVWMMVETGTHNETNPQRRFSYELDIRPKLDFATFGLTDADLATLENSLSKETRERQIVTVSLDATSHTIFDAQHEILTTERIISLSYLTRRISEVLENPFLSRVLATKLIQQLDTKLGVERVGEQFGFLTAELIHWLNRERFRQEEQIFEALLTANQLVLAVSDSPVQGYCLPFQDLISVDRSPSPYKYYLYDDVDRSSMNSLEQRVGEILDRQQTILWWFRNKVSRGWYAIQGWRRNKIRPDFVAAKKRADGGLELVYVLESKGEQLVGNADTTYKKQVLDKMTGVQKQVYQTKLDFGVLNESVEFYLIEQGREEAQIRTLF